VSHAKHVLTKCQNGSIQICGAKIVPVNLRQSDESTLNSPIVSYRIVSLTIRYDTIEEFNMDSSDWRKFTGTFYRSGQLWCTLLLASCLACKAMSLYVFCVLYNR